MKTKLNNANKKKELAKAYVDAQLDTLKKFGKAPKLSSQTYQRIVRHVERATA